MQNLMVDLETRGNKPGCALLSIGAVFFDEERGLGEEFYIVVKRDGQEAMGLHEDPETMAWWDKQSAEARQVLHLSENSEEAVSLVDALDQFTAFIDAYAEPGIKKVNIWGNGSDFDNAILAVAYMARHQNVPWEFWNNRCFRTLKAMFPGHKMPRSGTHHNALDDAKTQAEHACKLLKLHNLNSQGIAPGGVTKKKRPL